MELKGFVLSAGLGTRLRPITDFVPKALVKVGSKRLIEYSIDLLRDSGIESIGVNAHYKWEMLEEFCKDNGFVLFKEEDLLGTGGYLKNIESFFDCTLVTVNCDTVFFNSGKIVEEAVSLHIEKNNLITLVLKRLENNGLTPIGVKNRSVVSIGEGDYFFTGLQIISPEVLGLVERSIVDVFKKLIKLGKIGFVEYKGDWFDCGTLSGLISVNRFLFKSNDNVVYPGAMVSDRVCISNSVIYPSEIMGNGVIEDSIVYEGASLNLNGEKIKCKIIV